jgi:type IV secretory pathway VirJ component
MINRLLLYTLLLTGSCVADKSWAQEQSTASLPVSLFPNADTARPLIFYITGDGGWNRFSSTFVQTIRNRGYAVVALDARTYFWHKKSATQTASDVASLLNRYLSEWKRKHFILIGYSFGADVAPFAVTRFGNDLLAKMNDLVLMSPSAKTDFEVHVSGLLGFGNSSGESVPAEINKISKNMLLLFGDNENDFPLNKLTTKNFKTIRLPGGHHYDGDPAAVSEAIFTSIAARH